MKEILFLQEYVRIKRRKELRHYEACIERYYYKEDNWFPIAVAYSRTQKSADNKAFKIYKQVCKEENHIQYLKKKLWVNV